MLPRAKGSPLLRRHFRDKRGVYELNDRRYFPILDRPQIAKLYHGRFAGRFESLLRANRWWRSRRHYREHFLIGEHEIFYLPWETRSILQSALLISTSPTPPTMFFGKLPTTVQISP